MAFVNYAHRGASEYAPENTMSSFELGLQMGANGIETDVQLTRDNMLVLFHDRTLARVTGEAGCVSDYTYEELLKFRVKKDDKTDQIVLLQDFLKRFAGKGLKMAIELKQKGTAMPVAIMVGLYDADDEVIITSFDYEELLEMRAFAPNLECGFLAKEVDDALLARMKEDGICELCPPADIVTPEKVRQWKAQGFRVRAWGVKNTELMQRAYDAGVDGMTVNFPDKLAEYIQKA